VADFSFKEYFRKCFIGSAYGLSFPLTLAVLSLWLKDSGVSNSVIGVFSLFHWPFVFKFVFGVFIENYDIPYLTKKIGRNRSWIVAGYLVLISGIIGMSFSDPKFCLPQLILFASLTALGDGCKDVALYPYQIDGITKNHLGYLAGAVGFGQKIGVIAAKTGTLYLAYFFSWRIAYLFAAAAIFLQMLMLLFIKSPAEHYDTCRKKITKSLLCNSINKSLIVPFCDMIKEKEGIYLTTIILFYKSIDFMMQNMSRVFLSEIGFSKIDIANVQLSGGVIVIIGGLAGGYIIKKTDLSTSMICFAAAHAISFFSYTVLLNVGTVLSVLNLIIACEAFTGGCVTTAFIATFYTVCKTGSMYALLWGLHEVSGIFFTSIAGIAADSIGWDYYFKFIPVFYLIIMLSLSIFRIRSKHRIRSSY
jgi:PAT family beta-lactamase induction signal transducer AmpG